MNQLTYRYQHVLIIDDSKMDILFLKEIIQSLQYAEFITTFENPVNALNFLKRCEEKLPDLIFIDLSMPGIGGFEFIERFRREFSKKTRFIITTSSDDPYDIKASSMYDNIIHYFIKPVCKLDLINIE
jgi:two-component SAPR family response regulator